ncbi:hypothetical protein BJX99DRAFT_265397 [Aspergillus californicus]
MRFNSFSLYYDDGAYEAEQWRWDGSPGDPLVGIPAVSALAASVLVLAARWYAPSLAAVSVPAQERGDAGDPALGVRPMAGHSAADRFGPGLDPDFGVLDILDRDRPAIIIGNGDGYALDNVCILAAGRAHRLRLADPADNFRGLHGAASSVGVIAHPAAVSMTRRIKARGAFVLEHPYQCEPELVGVLGGMGSSACRGQRNKNPWVLARGGPVIGGCRSGSARVGSGRSRGGSGGYRS